MSDAETFSASECRSHFGRGRTGLRFEWLRRRFVAPVDRRGRRLDHRVLRPIRLEIGRARHARGAILRGASHRGQRFATRRARRGSRYRARHRAAVREARSAQGARANDPVRGRRARRPAALVRVARGVPRESLEGVRRSRSARVGDHRRARDPGDAMGGVGRARALRAAHPVARDRARDHADADEEKGARLVKRFGFLLVLASCSTTPSGVTVMMTSADAPPRYATAPFPTDALRDGDHLATIAGLDKLVGRYSDLVAAHVAALDGFGVRPLVEFFLDGDADPATLTSDTAGVVDPDGHAIVMDWNYDPDRHVLQGSPASGQVLREGTRYTAYVTRGVHDTSGKELQRSPELDAIVRSPAPRWRSTADAFRTLQRDDVIGLAVFTTQHATAPLVAARDAMASQPAPVLAFADPAIIFRGPALDSLLGVATRATDGPRAGLERWGNGNPTGMAHDHVGVVGTGTMTVVRFRRDTTGTHGPEDKTFELDAAGTPQVVALDQIPITFILPSAPPPPAGYPVVIYGHGLGASRDQMLGFAEPLTSKGFAIVGIDMVGHGSRFNPSDTIDNFSQYLPQFSGDPAQRDGFGDTTGLATEFDFFESFLGVSAIRDTIRQSALDLVRVSQLVHRGDLDLSALGPS